MKLYFQDPNNPYTKFLQLVCKYADVQATETILKKEEAGDIYKFGSLVAFEHGDESLFDYRAIGRLIAQAKPALLGNCAFEQALVDQWLDLAEAKVMTLGSTIVNQIFGRSATDMDTFNEADS